MKGRLRNGLLTILMVAVFACGAPRPAHAQFTEALVIAELILHSIMKAMDAAEPFIHTMLEGMAANLEMLAPQKLKSAELDANHQMSKHYSLVKSLTPFVVNIQRNACVAPTMQRNIELKKQQMQKQVAKDSAAHVREYFGSYAGASSAPGAPATDADKPAPDGNAAVIDTYLRDHCPFARPTDQIIVNHLCPTQVPGAPPTGSLIGADMNSTALLSSPAFQDLNQFAAAQAFCRNLMGNEKPQLVRGKQITDSLDNMNHHLNSMAEGAVNAASAMICLEAVKKRAAPAGDAGGPCFDQATSGACSYHQPSGAVGSVGGGNAVDNQHRLLTYQRLKEGLGWKDQASIGGLVRPYAWAPKDNTSISPPAYSVAAQHAFNGLNEPSIYQEQLASIGELNSNAFIEGKAGPESAMTSLVIAKSKRLAQQWQQYENLERDMLIEAIALARKSRETAGNF